jgi:hypothetical protein
MRRGGGIPGGDGGQRPPCPPYISPLPLEQLNSPEDEPAQGEGLGVGRRQGDNLPSDTSAMVS